jgi:hypothetical protein
MASTVDNTTEVAILPLCVPWFSHAQSSFTHNSVEVLLQVWDHKCDIGDIGAHGDVEHLRGVMAADGVRSIRLAANEMMW